MSVAVDRVEVQADGAVVASGPARVRVTAVGEGIYRVTLAPDGRFDETASWAVVPAAPPAQVEVVDASDAVRVTSGDAVAIVRKQPLRVEFADRAGQVLLADSEQMPMAWSDSPHGPRVRSWKAMPTDAHYYGLGDKAGPLDRRGRAFTMWNSDAYGWQGYSDPLYKSIPFFIGLRAGTAYGVFFDNTARSSFDFGKESEDVFLVRCRRWRARLLLHRRAAAGARTGALHRADRPHAAAADVGAGFQQSRYSYNPETKVREIAAQLREHRIPSDAIYLDIDYQDGYAPFSVDRKQFPHFEQMIADLRAQGLRTVLITDLHIKHAPGKGYAPFDSGLAARCLHPQSRRLAVHRTGVAGRRGVPGLHVVTRARLVGRLYRDFTAMGAAGYWNDMNEPSVFRVPGNTMSLDAVHRMDDGSQRDHRAIHNVYGMLNARATYEGLLKLQPEQRPFVLTRAAYAGTQRYAAPGPATTPPAGTTSRRARRTC